MEKLETDVLAAVACLLAAALEPALEQLDELEALLKRAALLQWP